MFAVVLCYSLTRDRSAKRDHTSSSQRSIPAAPVATVPASPQPVVPPRLASALAKFATFEPQFAAAKTDSEMVQALKDFSKTLEPGERLEFGRHIAAAKKLSSEQALLVIALVQGPLPPSRERQALEEVMRDVRSRARRGGTQPSLEQTRLPKPITHPVPNTVGALQPAPARGLPPLQYNGPVHVRGYFRKDGTYVRPHTRSR